MREAFTYMFKDNCFHKKAFIYFILSFIAMSVIAVADMNTCSYGCPINQAKLITPTIKFDILCYRTIGLILHTLTLGYFITCLEAVIKQKDNILLPFFNLKLCFTKGLKLFLSIISTVIIYYILLFTYGAMSNFIPVLRPEFVNILSLLTILFYIFCYNSFIYLYAQTNKFFSFFNFKVALLTIKNSQKTYFKYWSILVLIFVLSSIIVYIIESLLGKINNEYTVMLLTNFASSALQTYLTFVSLLLISKSIKADSVV